MADQTQTQTGATVDPTDVSSSSGTQSTGSETSQPTRAGANANANVEANGNSGSGDGNNGSDGDSGERQRPSRAERRISELAKQVSELQSVNSENERLKQILANPIQNGMVNIPDLGDEVTPERYKTDIINAADQLVKLRMGSVVQELQGTFTRSQANNRTLNDVEYVQEKYPELNPNSDRFDPKLEGFVSRQFQTSFRNDPNYSLRDLVEQVMEVRGTAELDNENQTNEAIKHQKQQGAISGNGSKQPSKSIDQMTADELEAYIKSGGR